MTSIPALYSIFKEQPLISTDSRQLSARCIFFALKGGRFDGNKFAAIALENGASYAVIDNPEYCINERCLLVPDVRTALQQLANYHRHQFEIPIISITGAKGKNIAKSMIVNVLSTHYACHFTEGKLNSHIGVPLTLLSMPRGTEVAVLEMEANQIGDMTTLCRIVQPTHGLLVDEGEEDRDDFGNLRETKDGYVELFDYLAQNHGCAFVDLSGKHLPVLTEKEPMRVGYRRCVTLRPDPGIIEIQCLADQPVIRAAFLSDDGPRVEITTQLSKNHHFQYVMIAIALGIYFKVPAERIKEALEKYSNEETGLRRPF